MLSIQRNVNCSWPVGTEFLDNNSSRQRKVLRSGTAAWKSTRAREISECGRNFLRGLFAQRITKEPQTFVVVSRPPRAGARAGISHCPVESPAPFVIRTVWRRASRPAAHLRGAFFFKFHKFHELRPSFRVARCVRVPFANAWRPANGSRSFRFFDSFLFNVPLLTLFLVRYFFFFSFFSRPSPRARSLKTRRMPKL